MSVRARIIAGVVVVAAALGLLLYSGEETPLRSVWPDPGQSRLYRFRYRTAHGDQALLATAEQPGVAIAGELDLAGVLSLSRDGSALVLRFEELERHRLRLLGEEVNRTDGLLGHVAVIELSSAGQVLAVRFAHAAPKLFRHVAQALALELQVVIAPDAGQWEVTEETPRGRSDTLYTRASANTLTKLRDDYVEVYALAGLGPAPATILVDSQATIDLDEVGAIVALVARETIVAETADGAPRVTLSARLELDAEGREVAAVTTAPPGNDLDVSIPGPPVVTPEAEARALTAATEGLTGAQLVADLERFGAGGVLPEHNRWFWRATSLLQLQPELCRDLLPLFSRPDLGPRGRGLVLDLLASVGHPTAQQTLVSALASADSLPDYGALLQRLSVVSAPTAETLAFLRQEYGRRSGPVGVAAAYALGAAIGHRAGAEGTSDAEAAHELLRDDLDSAREPRRRADLLRALGNAQRMIDFDLFAAAATDDEPLVRAAAAAALRRNPSPETADLLSQLCADANVDVQRAALIALNGAVDAGGLGELERLVREHRLHDSNADLLVNLLVPFMNESEIPRQIFAEMLAQEPKRHELAARLHILLEG